MGNCQIKSELVHINGEWLSPKFVMSQLLLNVNVLVSFLFLLMSLHLFCQRSLLRVSVRMLAACFLTMGLQALFLTLNISNHANDILAALQPAMAVLFGPLSYLIFRSALFNGYKLKSLGFLHLIPATLVFSLMLNQHSKIYADLFVLFSLLLYAILLTQIAWSKKQRLNKILKTSFMQKENIQDWMYIWLLIFIAYSWLILASDFLIVCELDGGKTIVQSFALLSTVLFKLLIVTFAIFYALQKSPMFDWLYTVADHRSEKAIDEDQKQVFEKIITLFEQHIEDSNVYTEEVLSLKAMADRLCVPVRTFSNAINHHYGERYAKRMNRLRVQFAEKLLLEQPDLPIVTLMYESGFKTKSSFNKEFKAISGLSPSEFRKSRSTF